MFRILLKYIEVFVLISIALYYDAKTSKIKNKVVYPFMIMGLFTNLATLKIDLVLSSITGLLAPIPLLIILYALRMLGAGDIKLFCAIGSIMGIEFSVYNIVYSFICGGVIAFFLIIINKNAVERFRYLFMYLKNCFLTLSVIPYTEFGNNDKKDKFKFAYAIFFGTILCSVLSYLNVNI